MLRTPGPERGFNLVEILISIAVIGILISLGAPGLSAWLQNQQIRAASEGIVNGLQVARSEAIRRNLQVQIVFVPPTTAWVICEASVAPCGPGTPAGLVIQSRAHEEGTTNAQTALMPDSPPTITVTFAPLGGVVAQNADLTFPVARIDVKNPGGGTCAADGGPMRCLRVVITGGGTIRMCDPTPGISASDPRYCPPVS